MRGGIQICYPHVILSKFSHIVSFRMNIIIELFVCMSFL
ncbi:BnaC05g32440D [Brassica napus]|uniref:BnaC05g32440D protein n=1 Tax=Brassica napus TaxID=3708 RepID=A0A078GDI1_BRANA|nr:BnaC05g32440D [Brassica napus]